MELCDKATTLMLRPSAAYLNLNYDESKHDDVNGEVEDQLKYDKSAERSWSISATNIRNLTDSLEPPLNPRWRIDGGGSFGTRFFAVPEFLGHMWPSHIDVVIEDQSLHPPALRDNLESCYAYAVTDKRVANLGISRFIVRVLEFWTESQADAETTIRSLRYGSCLFLRNICPDPRKVDIDVFTNLGLEEELWPIDKLREAWRSEVDHWPEVVDIKSLRLMSRIHDVVSLVQRPGYTEWDSETFIFKGVEDSVKHRYHELRNLLTMPSYSGIIQKPLAIVVVNTAKEFGRRRNLCVGFLLKYYPLGSLRSLIPKRRSQGNLYLKDQFRWTRQVISTLMFIRENTGRFYCDLKLDNLILSSTAEGEDVIFVDFEEVGNWMVWAAPEIRYLNYLPRLAAANEVPEVARSYYKELLVAHMGLSKEDLETRAGGSYSPQKSGNSLWMSLGTCEREAAEVYGLGLIIWCIFEGVGVPLNDIRKAGIDDGGLEFPDFRRTPADVQKLILSCTNGGLVQSRHPYVRRGGKFYPVGRSGVGLEPTASAFEAQTTAVAFWRKELDNMEDFLAARQRFRSGESPHRDDPSLFFLHRPRLKDVLSTLDEIETKFDAASMTLVP